MMRASFLQRSPFLLLAVALIALAALAVFLVHDARPAAAQSDEAYLCPGGADSSLNPTDLRAFGGAGVLTLGWINPETNRGMQYAVRWRKDGTAAWLNPSGAVGEVFHQQPRYTHDITGLEDGAAYDAQVRVILTTRPDGQTGPRACSEWVSVTGTTQAAVTPIWSATLTPQQVSETALGCDNVDANTANRCSTAGVLSPAQFSYGGNTHTVTVVWLADGGRLQVHFDSLPSGLSGLSLNVDGSSLLRLFRWCNGSPNLE